MTVAIASPSRSMGGRAEARNGEIARCLAMRPDYIFMMDDDQLMPSETLLADLIALDADIAVCDASNRGYADSNVRYHPDGSIAYATISCCLIKPSVFVALPTPWFSTAYEWREQQPVDGKLTWEVAKKYKDDNIGEDTYFTRYALVAGLSVKVLEGVKSPHFDLGGIL